MPLIIFTGGGTLGHVMPNLAVMNYLKHSDTNRDSNQYSMVYIGSKTGIETRVVNQHNYNLYTVLSGKWRRYASWQNISDIVKLCLGSLQAIWLIYRLKPAVIMSKGGYVALPVVIAGWLHRIPIIIHESDVTPGLVTRVTQWLATHICLTVPETQQYLSVLSRGVSITGIPHCVAAGNADRARQQAGFKPSNRPVILIMGGSLGSQAINTLIETWLPYNNNRYTIIHMTGSRYVTGSYPDYYAMSHTNSMGDWLALADLVICRGGAGSLAEIRHYQCPHIIIPLPASHSRGDQLHNARYFESRGISVVLNQADATPDYLDQLITETLAKADQYRQAMCDYPKQDSTRAVVSVILATLKSDKPK